MAAQDREPAKTEAARGREASQESQVTAVCLPTTTSSAAFAIFVDEPAPEREREGGRCTGVVAERSRPQHALSFLYGAEEEEDGGGTIHTR